METTGLLVRGERASPPDLGRFRGNQFGLGLDASEVEVLGSLTSLEGGHGVRRSGGDDSVLEPSLRGLARAQDQGLHEVRGFWEPKVLGGAVDLLLALSCLPPVL